jgi:S1-C subfamily serine protease
MGGLDVMGQIMDLAGKMLGRKPAPDVILRGFFGMTLEDGDGSPKVASVLEKGPADEAGLKKGDLISKVDGEAVKTVADLLAATAKKKAKEKVTLTVKRGDKSEEITLETKEGI